MDRGPQNIRRMFWGSRGRLSLQFYVHFAVAVCVRYKRLLQDSRGRLSLQFCVRFAVAVTATRHLERSPSLMAVVEVCAGEAAG